MNGKVENGLGQQVVVLLLLMPLKKPLGVFCMGVCRPQTQDSETDYPVDHALVKLNGVFWDYNGIFNINKIKKNQILKRKNDDYVCWFEDDFLNDEQMTFLIKTMKNCAILKEAPLADFGVINGDYLDSEHFTTKKGEGSFRQQDMKAINNPKWVEKVHDFFKKCPYDFNIYIFDGYEKYRNLTHTRGIMSKEFIKARYGSNPPNSENSINVIMTNNEGANRIALTPWILCHRVVHAFFDGPDTIPAAKNFIKTFASFAQFLAPSKFGTPNSVNGPKFFDEVAKLSNFKSAKDKKLTQPGEYSIELITEYILNGAIKFNLPDDTVQFGEHNYTYDFIANSNYKKIYDEFRIKYKCIKEFFKLDGISMRIPKNPEKLEKYNEILRRYNNMYNAFDESTNWYGFQKWKEIKYYEKKLNERAEEVLKQAVGKYFVL